MTDEAGELLAAAQEPVDLEETVDAAARRFAGEVWRLASGLADRGIPLDPHRPIDIAPVDTALAAIDAAHADGYARAIAALRDVVIRTGSPAAGWAADYLEAIDKTLPTVSPEHRPDVVSSVIAVSNRFARAAAGQAGDADWVRLRTGSGRTYEGYRSPTCPGDGQPGHRHDIRCVTSEERGTTS